VAPYFESNTPRRARPHPQQRSRKRSRRSDKVAPKRADLTGLQREWTPGDCVRFASSDEPTQGPRPQSGPPSRPRSPSSSSILIAAANKNKLGHRPRLGVVSHPARSAARLVSTPSCPQKTLPVDSMSTKSGTTAATSICPEVLPTENTFSRPRKEKACNPRLRHIHTGSTRKSSQPRRHAQRPQPYLLTATTLYASAATNTRKPSPRLQTLPCSEADLLSLLIKDVA